MASEDVVHTVSLEEMRNSKVSAFEQRFQMKSRSTDAHIMYRSSGYANYAVMTISKKMVSV